MPRSTHAPAAPAAAPMVSHEPGRRVASHLLGALIAATTLAWWPLTDRLDLPKLVVLSAGALVVVAFLSLRERRGLRADLALALLPLTLIVTLLAAPEEMAARVEGWAGWLAAGLIAVIARDAERRPLQRWLTGLALTLTAIALAQALGLPLFNAELQTSGRVVVATLGGPDHLGWTLAALLPAVSRWPASDVKLWLRRAALTATLTAILLTGSRVAWVMALVALALTLDRRALASTVAALLAALALAATLDALTDTARLGSRVADFSDAEGTARGRLYLWRAHLGALPELSPLGRGPEGFARAWPEIQQRHLEAHPEDEVFRSDLRHAHADPFEIYVDFGLIGLLLAGWLLIAALRGGRRGLSEPDPALATLAALAVGGLAASPLFFAPTLAIGAAALGQRLPPGEGEALPHRATPLLFAAALALTLWPLGARLRSEITRSGATAARAEGRYEDARLQAERATRLDPRNPRAWMELGATCAHLHDARCAADAFGRAARDLPTDAVRARLEPR